TSATSGRPSSSDVERIRPRCRAAKRCRCGRRQLWRLRCADRLHRGRLRSVTWGVYRFQTTMYQAPVLAHRSGTQALGKQMAAATVPSMSSNNAAILTAENSELEQLLDSHLTAYQLWLLGYDEQLERTGQIALLATHGAHYNQGAAWLAPDPAVADRVVDLMGLAALERHNSTPAAPILAGVSPAKARQLALATR